MQIVDISEKNEVFEQAVYQKEGSTVEILQLMGDVEVEEYLEDVDSVQELQATIPVIGQYQYIKVTFSKELKDAIKGWDTDATDVVLEDEEFINYLPSNEEQLDTLTFEQIYQLASTFLVDVYSYTSFENPNILEGHVEIQEG